MTYINKRKNPFYYRTWGEGTSVFGKESENPMYVLNYLIFKKPANTVLILNLIKNEKPEATLYLSYLHTKLIDFQKSFWLYCYTKFNL